MAAASILLFQFVINIGMTLGFMPVTGLPLPFVSYGGSSLLVSMAAIGLLNNVACQLMVKNLNDGVYLDFYSFCYYIE